MTDTTDAAVEAAAKAAFKFESGPLGWQWTKQSDDLRAYWRHTVRVTVAAYLRAKADSIEHGAEDCRPEQQQIRRWCLECAAELEATDD